MTDDNTTPPPHTETAGYRRKIRLTHAVVTALATLAGAVMGLVVTLALVVLEARFGTFIFALEDLLAFRWDLLPIPLGAFGGFRLAQKRHHALPWATVWGIGAMILGIAIGALVGPAIWGAGVGAWAGGVIGGALGLVTGAVLSLQVRRIPRHPLIAGGASLVGFLGLAVFAIFGATNLLDIDPLEFSTPTPVPVPEASAVDAVVFLVGDAGAAVTGRSPLLAALRSDIERWSLALRRDSAVSVAFLGDNVYPSGVRDREDPDFPEDSARLWSQIDLVADSGARRYKSLGLFTTGNHDWANSASDLGLDRVLNQSREIQTARALGRYVSLLPAAGEPGPVYRDLRRNVRIAVMDTHWFLRERHPSERARFFERLKQMIDGAKGREVILLAHHAYRSAGPHGMIVPGYHTLGVAYILKQAGALLQDLNSPPYADLLSGLRQTFNSARKPPLIYAGGHDHSLQVLTSKEEFDPRFTLVSGSGSKLSTIQMGTGLVWGASRPGYMMLVFRKDDGVDLFVVAGDPARLACPGAAEERTRCMTEATNAFGIIYSASLLGESKEPRDIRAPLADSLAPGTPWWTDVDSIPTTRIPDRPAVTPTPAPVAVPTRVLLLGTDSVTATPGRSYPAGRIRRFFAGDLNRALWQIAVKLPVLDLRKVGGGLTPLELIGGKQTMGLRLQGADGLEYDFRPIVKDPSAVLPAWMREGVAGDLMEDQMAAQFPFGATIVAELQAAAGIPAPRPTAVVMPNDELLGEYRSMFAGRMGLIAVNANERPGGRPGFAGYTEVVNSDTLYRRLQTEPDSRIDAELFLRARLIDMLVGDWDRHSGQWRWGRDRQENSAWRPIPEDRDWAFSSIDGVFGAVARWLHPSYVGFSAQLPPVRRLAISGVRVDQAVLNQLDREAFVRIAAELQARLTDSVLGDAVGALPAEYLPLTRARLTAALRLRRNELARVGDEYYRRLAREIHLQGIVGAPDTVEFIRLSDERVRVRVRTGAAGVIRFERLLDGRETREVKLFWNRSEDKVIGGENLPFRLTIVEEVPGGG